MEAFLRACAFRSGMVYGFWGWVEKIECFGMLWNCENVQTDEALSCTGGLWGVYTYLVDLRC